MCPLLAEADICLPSRRVPWRHAALNGVVWFFPEGASRWLEHWVGPELGKLPQILRDGREQELILCPARAAQSQPAKSEDPLQMGEQHLDPLAISAGLLEGGRVIEGSGHIASLFVDVAGNLAMGRIRAALQFERAPITFGLL